MRALERRAHLVVRAVARGLPDVTVRPATRVPHHQPRSVQPLGGPAPHEPRGAGDRDHHSCSVGRIMISLTATRQGRVTMYSMASAMSSASSRSTPSKRLRAASTSSAHLLHELGDDRARLDERDAQVARRELLPQRLAEGADAVLGEVVDGRAAVGAAARDRADVDQVAHLARAVLGGGQQVLDRRMGDVEDAVDVDVDHPLPVVERLVGRLVEQHHACVVDDRVEPAQLVDGPADRAGRLLAVGDVGLDDQRVDLRPQGVEPVLAARRDRDLRAGLARLRAVASPMPLLAPVTSATVPSSRSPMPGMVTRCRR